MVEYQLPSQGKHIQCWEVNKFVQKMWRNLLWITVAECALDTL